MRVLLINPWQGELFPTPSIGYLQAILKSNGIEVDAVDISNAFQSREYDLVAVTFHSFSVKYAKQIREYYKGNRLICGGHHPSALPEQLLELGYDQVVIGEGEQAILDIVDGDTSKVIKGKLGNLSTLPIPDYTGLVYNGLYGLPIISSRGCPFVCNFCASTQFWGRSYRARSTEDVLEEIEIRLSEGMRTWMFEDDNFTLDKSRAISICKGIEKMGSHQWQCASRAESLDEELCAALSKAGCSVVWLGVESLSQSSLDRCNKNTTVQKILDGIATAEKFGIQTMSQFIVGIPGDTLKNIQETIIGIKSSKIRRKGSNILWVLPNTQAYRIWKREGFSDTVYLETGAPYYTLEQNLDTLLYWSKLIQMA